MITETSIPVLTGPTASGKTAIAIEMARELGAEIISADSRQCYRELVIGTDTPNLEERGGVPHHFLADRSLRDPLTAGSWAREAVETIRSVQTRGNLPLVVGGSTLYLKALIFGIARIPETPPGIREALNARLRAEGPGPLHAELVDLDPVFAATLDATKSQRIVRGLEVFQATGRPISSFFEDVERSPYSFDVLVIDRDRTDLYARIDRRVDRMIERGLMHEVRELMTAGFDPGRNPLRTIGYTEAAACLRGEITLERAIELIKRNSRRYAKRQLTWLRGFDEFEWTRVTSETREQVAQTLAGRVSGRSTGPDAK